ncbi:MAG: hypothetical protein HY912_14500 [Desulfomonile tiedjei]|uniref:Uncharacterized protein n=1 Tax=Desulfomonile tiedjei TaxID=2358 RepID=A0A9D6V3A8_9BACT|nr:hypothetical protein [Desulfomonile tiedjei]
MQTESISSEAQIYSDTVIKQFHPLVAQFGFTNSEWDYDPELHIVRVQFDNPRQKNAVQIDCHLEENSYSANYCRNEGDWQMCVEGRHKTLVGLRATLSRWILRQCPECGPSPVDQDEFEE